MASGGEIKYEFTASVADLEQKAVVAQKVIEDKVTKQIDAVGEKSTVSDKKIVTMFKNIAREGKAVHPMFGKIAVAIASIEDAVVPLYRSFETFFNKLQPKLAAFGASILGAVSNPLGLVVAGLGALVAAGAAASLFFGEGSKQARAYAKALAEVEAAETKLAATLQAAEIRAAARNDPKIKYRAIVEESAKAIEAGMATLMNLRPELSASGAKRVIDRKSELQPLPKSPINIYSSPLGGGGEVDANQALNEKISKTVETLRERNDTLEYYTNLLRETEERENALKEMEEDWLSASAASAKETGKAISQAEEDRIKAMVARGEAAEKLRQEDEEAFSKWLTQDAIRQQAEDEAQARYEQQMADRVNIAKVAEEQVTQSRYAFVDWAASLQANMADVLGGMQSLVSQATSGIGDAFARALVYGESFGEMMDQLWKSMAASLISMVIQVALQQLIYLALTAFSVVAAATTKIAAEMTYGAVAAAASVYASIPFPLNMALAPAAGTTAIATMTGLAGAGKAAGIGIGASLPGLAEGGLVTGAMLALVGEGGEPELVAPRSDYERLFEGQNNQGSWHVYLDGQELTRSFAKRLPGELRKHGVR